MKTKAAVLRDLGKDWEIVEMDLDPPKAGEVLMRWEAAGLCHSDEHLRTGDIPVRYPIVGGHEGAGIVEEVGAGVTRLKPGDHVVCSFLPVCGHCRFCARGMTNLCDLGALLLDPNSLTIGASGDESKVYREELELDVPDANLLAAIYPDEPAAGEFHAALAAACHAYDPACHARFKAWCDEYFFLKHRNEPRGVGGIFFDDLNEGGFERCFDFMRSVGDSYLDAYLPIARRRRDTPYGERERDFQLYRRGRYVEFNLLWDRGTLFGLQSGGRTESILMSMPPEARWRYDFHPEEGSPEAALLEMLKPRDWV